MMGGHVAFFCTVGRGMERFVLDEVSAKLSAVEVESLPGKVFFKGNPDLCALRKVKSAERLFLLLHKGPPLTERTGNVFVALRSLVQGDESLWQETLRVWETFQDQLPPQGTSHGQEKAWKRRSDHDPTELKPKTSKEEAARPPGEPVGPERTAHPLVGPSAEPITFRVSCRCAGVYTKTMTAQDISRIIGVSLSKEFGWKPDLRHPRLEIFVHLNDMYSVVGFPILRQSLANRDYIQRAGLRATTAWAMASMAEISTAKYILDPMCGVGTILLEAAMEWPHAIFLGVDKSESQLKIAVKNVKKAGVMGSVAFLRGSVLALPVLPESMDVVVSDIPFGRKFTCSKDITELLPDIIHQMEKVLRVRGVLVLLLSQKLHYNLKTNYKFKSNESENLQDGGSQRGSEDSKTEDQIAERNLDFPTLIHVESHPVSLGATEAVIFKCKKTSRAVTL
ncbi:THUMP domain-containing protein 2 [Phyllobates terribilis]|uniref:THUMP domain-containing protein 2 n=1 Tax=Phyllobates terribilis TaxID=111132 RepID=UPI003CCA8612